MKGLLEGKNALILGIANHFSVAWGIARSFDEAGANQVFTYRRPRVRRNLERLNLFLSKPAHLIGDCDVTGDEALDRVFQEVGEHFGGKLDVLVHSVAGS